MQLPSNLEQVVCIHVPGYQTVQSGTGKSWGINRHTITIQCTSPISMVSQHNLVFGCSYRNGDRQNMCCNNFELSIVTTFGE